MINLAEDLLMDAAYTSLKKTAFLFALATLIPAAAFGQQLALSASTVNIAGQFPGTTSVTSTTTPTTEIAYTATVAYIGGDPNWVCVNDSTVSNQTVQLPASFTTPSTLNFVVCPNVGVTFASTLQHTATVTLTPTSPAGATAVAITVNYTVGSSGAGGGTGGALTITPAAPSASLSFVGGVTTLSFTATTSSATNISFTLTQPGVSWAYNFFQTGGTAGIISSASPATFSVTLNGAGQSQTTLSTQLFINYSGTTQAVTISFGNGVGSGGSTSGSLQVSQTSVSLAYSTVTPLNFPSASVNISSSADTSYFFSCSSGNFWLEASVTGGIAETTGSGTLPGTLTITVDPNVEQLTAGQSNGTVTITGSPSGSVIVISVGLTVNGANASGLTLSPSPLAIAAALNGAAVSQQVTIISTTGGSVTASISGSGLTISAPASSSIGANGQTTVTVTGTPTGLSAQTYTGQLSVSVGGVTQFDQVNFTVGSGSTGTGGSSFTAAPSSMTFASETGFATNQFQQVYLAGSGNYTAAATVSNGGSWLSVSSTSGTLPVPNGITVEASPNGLAAGTYTGAVTFTNTSTGATSVISVTLLVTGTTAIYAFPGDLVFNYIAGTSSAAQSEEFVIATTDGSVVTVSAAPSNPSGSPWLTSTLSGTSVIVTVNASNLANGVYTGYITVTGLVTNSPVSVPVVLGVTGSSVSSGSGTLTLGSSALTLSPQVNGSAVSTTLGVSASTNTSYTVSSLGSYNGVTWLSVSPSGTLTTSGNPNLTVTATPFNFPAGTYSGSITLSANGGLQTVQVTMVIGGSVGASGNITVTANGGTSTSPTLSFSSSTPGATLTQQYLTVASALGSSGVGFQATTSTTNGINWILVSTSAANYTTSTTGTTPATLYVTLNTTALTAGTFNGSVILTPTGGTAVTVPVTLTLGAAAIAVSTTALSFNYQAGGATPNTQSVSVTVSNAATGAFTAAATSTPAGWLSVTPTSGTAPGSLIVSIVPSGLSAGTYSGSIAVTGTSPATGSSTINVTLTVTVPLPTITAVVNAASFVNEPISPGEIITIGGTSIGPATPASFTVTTSFGSQFVPTSGLAGVQVLVNGFPAPVLYVSAGQINAIVPYEIAGFLNPTVLVKFLGQSSNGFVVTAAATAAGIFTTNGSGSGPGAILNSDLSVNSASNAAARGSEIVIYMTGEGQTSPAGVDGKVTTAPYPAPLLPIAVTIGGAPATVAFMGEAPGLVSGVLQLNVIVPNNLTTTGAVPVSVTFGTTSTSQGGVTVNIR
jgi:uncharacterized protein (TIGR03437 family)